MMTPAIRASLEAEFKQRAETTCYCAGFTCSGCEANTLKLLILGAEALERILLENAEPFDEKACETRWMEIWEEEKLKDEDFITPGYAAYENGIKELARWQHSQSAAEIAALRKESNKFERLADENYSQCLRYEREIEKLKADLAIGKTLLERVRGLCK